MEAARTILDKGKGVMLITYLFLKSERYFKLELNVIGLMRNVSLLLRSVDSLNNLYDQKTQQSTYC